MASTPLDILDNDILPRLPAKSLVRFKCVSKKWLALISSHEFILRHLDYALSSNSNQLLILTGNDGCLYSFNLDLPKTPAVKLPSFGVEPFVVGSCNGLVCIQSYRPCCLVLLNPSTGSYREIPSLLPPRRCSALNFGFGYDCNNDDYKVVRIVDRYPSMGFLGHQMDRIVHVYSSRANSWEVIERTSPQDSMGNRENGVLINNNLLHWKFWSLQEGKYQIRCFNLCEKQWTHDVPLPDYMGSIMHSANDIRDGLLDFGVLEGCLYLSTKNPQQPVIDIWVMHEYGVKKSWVKVFQISDSCVFGSLQVSPIAYDSLNHQILLRTANKTEHKVLWYDIKGETTKSAEINGVADCIWIDVCKGSLVNVPGGSQIRKSAQKDGKEGMSF
ncbi:F-box protein CPR30-like isoform X1 [Chenopodium quinoa]|uniref:F-box protein CPR30-like isoform X1 n=1 Tax=Chenopodium quinoa TaxID=63459 RepID=UPI000B7700B9|nr:F-box protein CPR30-like isoform X1 [Chenopodium quinoa]XP_021765773.1 F-box protein CPR30-like isoform X1 [Chenopodium quinoa]